jgi:hypothetical protein
MKMNMQVTSDTLCQTPQLAPMKKRQMQTFDKDNIMTSVFAASPLSSQN